MTVGRWFVVSVPKSGTHLVLRLVALCGAWAQTGAIVELATTPGTGTSQESADRVEITHTGRPWYSVAQVGALLDAIGPGRVTGAHVPDSDVFDAMLAERDIKPVAVLRDPRDVAVSRAHWWTSDRQPDAVRLAAHEMGLDERIRLSAQGGQLGSATIRSTAQLFDRFVGWLDRPGVTVVRFEDLLASDGVAAVTAAAGSLGLPVPTHRAAQIHAMLFGDSATFRRGAAGSWLDETTEATRDCLRAELGPLAQSLGYDA